MLDAWQGPGVQGVCPIRVEEIRDILFEAITPLLAGSIDLAAFPLHDNCGDNAIWLGERKVLHKAGISDDKIRAFTHAVNEGHLRKVAPTVLVRGGGNFGDLWPEEHASFLAACRIWSESQIISMPQTASFSTREAINETRAAIKSHGGVTIFVRDRRSREFVLEELGCEDVYLCPDTAFALTKQDLLQLTKRGLPQRSLGVVARTDSEGDGTLRQAAALRELPLFDWLGGSDLRIRSFRWVHELLFAHSPRIVRDVCLSRLLPQSGLLDGHAKREVARAATIITTTQVLLTDRLHGAILGAIAGSIVIAVDTGYGKLREYFATWPTDNVTVVDTVDEAIALGEAAL